MHVCSHSVCVSVHVCCQSPSFLAPLWTEQWEADVCGRVSEFWSLSVAFLLNHTPTYMHVQVHGQKASHSLFLQPICMIWSMHADKTHTKTFINKLHKVQKGAFHKRSVEAFRSQRARKEQQRLSVIRAFRRKLSKTLRILFKTREAWRARTRALLKIFSRRKRRAVSVICPAARFGPLLAHNTTVKNPPKNWQKLQDLQLPLITHTHTATAQRWSTDERNVRVGS